jgi:hypothetical protein
MKNLLTFIIILLFPAGMFAQTIDSQSQKLIDAFVKSNIDLKTVAINKAAVGKVFSGQFSKVLVGFIEAAGTSWCGDTNYVNINEGKVKMIEGVHMDLEAPILLSVVKRDFLLKDEAGAKLFEAALNVLYPVEAKEKPNIRHMKKGTQWIFIRNKFFDAYTTFLVTVDAKGTISKIDLKLGYEVK